LLRHATAGKDPTLIRQDPAPLSKAAACCRLQCLPFRPMETQNMQRWELDHQSCFEYTKMVDRKIFKERQFSLDTLEYY